MFSYSTLLCQQSISGVYTGKIMKEYCFVCNNKITLLPKGYTAHDFFHRSHTLYQSKNDEKKYAIILNGIDHAQREHKDTLLFF